MCVYTLARKDGELVKTSVPGRWEARESVVYRWMKTVCFSKYGPRTFVGGARSKRPSSSVDTCTDGAKERAGKTAGALARITEWHRTILADTLCPIATHSQFTKKKSISPKSVLDEAVKTINCIKYWLFSTHRFNIPSDKIVGPIKPFCCQPKYDGYREENSTCVTELQVGLATLSHGAPFLFERIIGKLWLFRRGYL